MVTCRRPRRRRPRPGVDGRPLERVAQRRRRGRHGPEEQPRGRFSSGDSGGLVRVEPEGELSVRGLDLGGRGAAGEAEHEVRVGLLLLKSLLLRGSSTAGAWANAI